MVEKAKETPSVTKPLTSNGDARTVHPKGGNASYEKGYDREHPFKGVKYDKVGSKGKCCGSDGAERKRPGGEKVNYETGYDRTHPHNKEGYSKVGTKSKSGGDGAERKESAYKKKPHWR